MGRLDNKVALITGATGGIGETTAKRFLAEGARVMLVGRNAGKLQEAVERLGASDDAATAVADAGDEDATAAAVSKAVQTFGGLDILFANAGTEGVARPLHEQSRDDVEALFRTNLLGVWIAMKHAVEPMKKRGGGSIIATASIAGLIGFPGLAPYVASKHGVIGLVKTAALELGPEKIRANAIAPGPIDNRMMTSVTAQLAGDKAAAARSGIEQDVALRRYGTNEEVANLALFLASEEAAYCTGGVYTADGGYVAA
ncbi:MAG: SDR family NAD(P)-dependent oxidoreductase [Hyphococcus sp.]